MEMKPIGGFFELELRKGKEYHFKALRLNSGRNALEYILRAKRYRKVFLPYYACRVLMEPVEKLGLESAFYRIDKQFRPLFTFSEMKKEEAFVYINYFGLCDDRVHRLSSQCRNLIVDNSQAFFSMPRPGVDTFYSPRKFFGLPDGGYLYTDTRLGRKMKPDRSHERCGHLLGRMECGAEKYYQIFTNNENSLSGIPIKSMSSLTRRLLKSIDYEHAIQRRKRNFEILHDKLARSNKITIRQNEDQVPMTYPYWPAKKYLRRHLIDNKIFVPRYWPDVLQMCGKKDIEFAFAENILALPIDQRYTENDMKTVIRMIEQAE
jgi:hypothetical protein